MGSHCGVGWQQLRAGHCALHGCHAVATALPSHNLHCLQALWAKYIERFRNLAYLEARLAGYQAAEQADADGAERRRRKLQRKLAYAFDYLIDCACRRQAFAQAQRFPFQ
jgi:hypothetical protein